MAKDKVGVVIPAAGDSERMGNIDKIFAPLDGLPVIIHTVSVFQYNYLIDEIVVVFSERQLEQGQQLLSIQGSPKPIHVCIGGRRRQDSVAAGLNLLKDCQWIIIHDGARPLVTDDLINRGLEAAKQTGAAVAAVPSTDTIKLVGRDGIVSQTPPCKDLWLVQTPQVFRADIIKDAYNKQAESDFTDDASLVEMSGYKVKIYQGSYDNIKITHPEDLPLAESLWKKHGK